MLVRIHISNLAIVSRLEVEFERGMTALTGETGAGKSILIDALGLALGDRADSGMIRAGSARAEITAVFDLGDAGTAADWLRAQQLDAEEGCILRRVLVRDGQSRAYINGTPAPLKSVQALGELLVDIHGQHAHQSLLRSGQQRELLDAYAGHQRLLSQLVAQFRDWQQAKEALAQLRQLAQEQQERRELLAFQIDELSALALAEGEVESIDQEQRRLGNADQLRLQCATILELLDEADDSARSRLLRAGGELDEMLALEPSLEECRELLESASIQIDEAVSLLHGYADTIELDPARLQQVERRLGEIQDMARKYRCRPPELPALLQRMRQEMAQIGDTKSRAAETAARCSELEEQLLALAGSLHQSRAKAAKRLAAAVRRDIAQLGMPDGRIEIALHPLPAERVSSQGLDRVEFLVSANRGQPPQPLAKVASGGELSRISLAIQVATIQCGSVPTLIFDEVDVGIGGGVAEITGRLLRTIGDERQVLCVTHLPQVAAQAHHHQRISKVAKGDRVQTSITDLEGEARVDEVARMLGGVEITANTRANAREMIAGKREADAADRRTG
ncbi:MAG: DNA repair protein RecN [Gammaproteobacteria bacterium]|nr:DNA repair protein RecN [Gammaproteobacteria bacterium]